MIKDSFFDEVSDNQYGVLEEENKGQDFRFYVYDFDNEDTVEWFNTYEQAEQYIKDNLEEQ